jgi:hypothetical protein
MELSAQYETVGARFDIPMSYAGSSSRSAHTIPLVVAESAVPYRPRHPEQTPFYQLFDKHFDDYVYANEERFKKRLRIEEILLGSVRPKRSRTLRRRGGHG